VKAGSIVGRFRVQQSLVCLPGELPVPLLRAQDVGARSWVLVERFPEDAPAQEVEDAAYRSSRLAAAGGEPRFDPLVDKRFAPPAHLAWALGGGETLRERLKRKALTPAEAAETGLAIARTVRRLHRAGIVHGSLRPANIQLVTGDGVRLLAPSSLGPVTLAIAGEIAESPSLWSAAYLSPEQIKGTEDAARGLAAPFTTADDVWTLGVVLHELVTGELPFLANTHEGMRRAVSVQAVDLAGTLPGAAPEPFEAVFARVLDRDASRRRAALDDAIGLLEQAAAELLPRVQPVQDSVARVRARKTAIAGDRSTAAPVKGEWQSAFEALSDRRRRLARERPPPSMWRVWLLPLVVLLLAGAVAALILL